MTRHRWGDPLRMKNKTERECAECGLIKVTRHEVEAGRDIHWTEFWRGLDRIHCDGTPACEPKHPGSTSISRSPRKNYAGAVLTDKYGPVEHLARLRGDQAKLDTIAQCRALPRAAE